MEKPKFTTREMTNTAIAAALVFLATYLIKVPSINGYIHLGDCMIFISVLVLGTKKGALAGGIGAALSDALGGYTNWILPTFFIKAIMAVVMGVVVYKVLKDKRFAWLIGAIAGGVVQVLLYTVANGVMYGMASIIESFIGDTVQTVSGIIVAGVIIAVLDGSGVINKLRMKMAQ